MHRRRLFFFALVIASLSLAGCDDSSGGGGGGGGGGDGGTGDGGGDGGGGSVSTNLTAGDVADVLAAHNQARGSVDPSPIVALPALAWSDDLAHDAALWASQCKWSHSSNGHGENIYASSGGASGTAVVGSWVSEKANYDYTTNDCAAGEVCGHYTQVVWADTTHVGCAKQACTTGSPFGSKFPNWEIWVCDYDPPGNFNGERPY